MVASDEPAETSKAGTITTVLHPGWDMVGWVGTETPAPEISLPHETDGRDAPVLVFVGDLSATTRKAQREEFLAVQAFYRDRLGAPPGDYTLYIGANAKALADVYRQIVGQESTHSSYCSVPRDRVLIISLQCEPQLAFYHGQRVVHGLADAGRESGSRSRGPTWLILGSYAYAADLYKVDAGLYGLDRLRSNNITRAKRTQWPLKDAFARDSSTARGLAILAVDWLVERAGERAIFDYYRRLHDSATWKEAFEAAFGIAIDDFYEQFEAYRAQVTSEEHVEAREPTTIMTMLHPGWNMVGWVGPETPASDLFDEIPALAGIYAWDSETGGYRLRARPIVHLLDPLMLAPGEGLWLYLDGEAPVEWTREASESPVLLDLRAGRNLVPWAGRDGTPIEEATVRVRDRLVRAWRWDAEAAEYRLYHPDAGASTLAELNHGDALLVELTEDARWWQSGAGPPPVVLLSDYAEATQANIRGWVDDTQAFFAERWGVLAPFTTYLGEDRDSLSEAYRRERGRDLAFLCGDHAGGVIFMAAACVEARVHAHEYFHAIQFHLTGRVSKPVPHWMIEGSATYAEVTYQGYAASSETAEEWIEQRTARYASEVGSLDWPELSAPASDLREHPGLEYSLGFLAVDWLAEHAGDQSIIDFFTALADEPSWQEAFEPAFGISVDDFYEEFGAYRSEVAPRLPHLTDDLDAPALVFVGDVPAETEEAFRTEFDNLTTFFNGRFGIGEADYTVFAGVDEDSLAAAHLRVFGYEAPDNFCDRQRDGRVAVLNLNCENALDSLESVYFEAVRAQLAPLGSLPVMPYGCRDRGPVWLDWPAEAYVSYAYRDAMGRQGADEIWRREVAKAHRVTLPLPDIVDGGVATGQYWDSVGLGFLALDWLAERAGDAALFEYYRLLNGSSSWVGPFEAAYGMTVADFYEAFERDRVKLAPPFPHATDGLDAPVLVFLGDTPSETRDAIRAEFDALQTLFRERFGAATADYTLYVGADRDAVVDPYIRALGTEPPEEFCSRSAAGGVAIINAGCETAAFDTLGLTHFRAVRSALAPLRAIPRMPTGFSSWGPRWLEGAAEAYVNYTYGSALGAESVDRIRDTEFARAGQTLELLSSFQSSTSWSDHRLGKALGFVALTWLADRAGEEALFEYYRLLPESSSWEDAFEGAFGITVDDFYEAFEEHRAKVVSPFPHLADAGEAPVLEFVGDLPASTRNAVRQEFEAVRAFFRDRLGAPPGDYTLYVGADAPSLGDVYRQIEGRESTSSSYCSVPRETVLIISLQCEPQFAFYHGHIVVHGLPDAGRESGSRSRGPTWLILGSYAYAADLYKVDAGLYGLDRLRSNNITRAKRTQWPLKDAFARDSSTARGLAILAVDWLVERAGERAIFDYYRRLPDSATWKEAFEAAFGITIDNFYEQFEAYRARVAPPN
ncbi:MAG: hypothetical protein F4X80_04475 [Chloroflexi bacterium]|nr:hypothetical protein [Chloroflexota bacterium]